MYLTILCIPAVLLLGAAEASGADFQKGLEAFEAGDYAVALRELRPLAKQGDAKAQYKLGLMYALSDSVVQVVAQGMKWCREAAGIEDNWAHYAHGVDFQGIAREDALAVEWCRKAAEQGDAQAQYTLGAMYEKGQGVAQDDTLAAGLYRKAAEQGHAQAQYNLGAMYEKGQGVARDDTQALKWYRKAVGRAEAQYALGTTDALGKGVAVHEAKAPEPSPPPSQAAALQPPTQAPRIPVVEGELSKGLVQDDVQTLEWYRKAAGQGDADAQYALGAMYAKGDGVARDDTQAAEWYRKAAGQGVAWAQATLGFMYHLGQGVAQDYVQAHMWYNLAAAQGDKDAAKWRDKVAESMTSAQVTRAQRLARSYNKCGVLDKLLGDCP